MHQAGLATYEDLVPFFAGHPFTTERGIAELRQARVIAAICAASDKQLVLFGKAEVKRARANNEHAIRVLPVAVESFEELQFILASISKFVGPPDADGEGLRHLWP